MDISTASQAEAAPLFGDWRLVETVADRVLHAGVELRRVGLAARRPDGAVVSGSAASTSGDPFERARFELMERAALVDAMRKGTPRVEHDAEGKRLGRELLEHIFPPATDPTTCRPSLSNGVAIGPDLAWATERARLELVERDRLLRAWYGELEPVALGLPGELPAAGTYDWRAASFPSEGEPEHVVGVFAFPRRAEAPLLRGFAARATESAALEAALAEALQGLAFLWGEEIPATAPALSPTPIFHLDHYLWPGSHAVLADWLERGHGRFGRAATGRRADALRFFDLTPGPLRRHVRVIRACRAGAAPLVFGDDPAAAHLPADRRVHPIS
jgi:hypothetical protein